MVAQRENKLFVYVAFEYVGYLCFLGCPRFLLKLLLHWWQGIVACKIWEDIGTF